MAKKKMTALVDLNELAGKLEAARSEILKESAPLHKKRDTLVAKIQPLEKQLREINQQIKEIEFPALRELGKQLAVLSRLNPTTKTMVAE